MITLRNLILVVFALAFPVGLAAQQDTSGVYVIFDASGSMWQKLSGGKRKIVAAREVMQDFFSQGFGDKAVALRAYGHRRKGDCSDTQLIQGFSSDPGAMKKMQRFIKKVNPQGKTPISRSLRAALKDFGSRGGEIVLISDGSETCDTDPCALVQEWAKRKVEINVHVVGLGLSRKERKSMKCIADASGTEYIDAGSTSELMAGLGKIRQQVASQDFKLVATDKNGQVLRADGLLTTANGEQIPVSTNARYVVEPGAYQLTAGVRTRNGNLFRPLSQKVTVNAAGRTRVDVVLAVPPRVSVRYRVGGQDKKPTGGVEAYQEGRKIFGFRAIDEIYVDEGDYEFRAQPDHVNKVTQNESFVAGDRKVVTFDLVKLVRLRVHFKASGSKVRYRGSSPELWQDGAMKFKLNGSSGGKVIPGKYDAIFSNALTGKIVESLDVTGKTDQTVEVLIPSGQTTFVYENPDGSRAKDKRVFVARSATPNTSKYVSGGKKTDIPVGKYKVKGFQPPKGYEYPRIDFAVALDADQTVVLRPVLKR